MAPTPIARTSANTPPLAAPASRHPHVSIRISDDGMHAHLLCSLPSGAVTLPLTLDQLRTVLKAHGITRNETVDASLADYAQALNDPTRCPGLAKEPFLIAHGKLPIEATDPFIGAPEQGVVDPSALEPIPAGTVIGHVVPGRHGIPGVTVFGTAISPQRSLGKTFRLGDGLRFDQTRKDAIVSTRAGLLAHEGDHYRIVKLTTIEGDVNAQTGSIDSPTDVRIRGSIKTGARVRSQRSIVIEGQIEGGSASSQHRLIVREGIFGSTTRPRIHSGGWARTPICEQVLLLCDSGLEIDHRMVNCNALIRGRIEMPEGAIIGGTTWAREGLAAHTIGCESGADTLVGAGAPPWYLQRCADRARLIATHQEQARALRGRLAPLVVNMNRLTGHQREQVTHLLCRCEQIEELVRTSSCEGQNEDSIFQPDHPARIEAQHAIHAGVRIRLGMLEARITARIDGPVSIFERTMEGGGLGIWMRGPRGEAVPLPAEPIPTEVLRTEATAMLPALADIKSSAEH
ncbi:MAG: DUF342 domain-containing protein [Phycisphaerales bacterium]|nr:DUF342 domain-containing protein [Phycisphaerales bacterium]